MCSSPLVNPFEAVHSLPTNATIDSPEPSILSHSSNLQLQPDSLEDTDLPCDPCGSLAEYKLVGDGLLDPRGVFYLVSLFADYYHSYFPIVRNDDFRAESIASFAADEKYLFTAILTVASEALSDVPLVHEYCSAYMRELISEVAMGMSCGIDAVEALLLLAQWEPSGLFIQKGHIGCGEESRAAWMHIGLALRMAYCLRLDRAASQPVPLEDAGKVARQTRAWAFCCLSQRLISVCVRPGTLSGGPRFMPRFYPGDFGPVPHTDIKVTYQERYCQALSGLAHISGTFHGLLEAELSTKPALEKDSRLKYVEDFRRALCIWRSVWGILVCPRHMKAVLQLTYEHLRYYINTFALKFQICQADEFAPSHAWPADCEAIFDTMDLLSSSPYMDDAVDSAKAYLNILAIYIEPENHLRFMPLRYHLQSVHASLFLYKVRSLGYMTLSENVAVHDLVCRIKVCLEKSSVRPTAIGSRCSRHLQSVIEAITPNHDHLKYPVGRREDQTMTCTQKDEDDLDYFRFQYFAH